MATTTQRYRGKTVNPKRSLAPKKWRNILCAIPGYDPFDDAEGCRFDADSAQYYIDFIEQCCTHIEGELAGRPFKLEKWQKAIVANIFGWFKQDFLGREVRRYRKVFIYVPRKNGKTPFVAAIHNAIFFMDKEAGQVNNLAAASADQASKLYRHIDGMIQNEPEMEKRCKTYVTYRKIMKPDLSVTQVIPADAAVRHGDNPHFQAMDELHTQPDRRLYDTLTSAMSSANRVQPIFFMITTADYDRPSICNEEYNYAIKVRDGIIKNQTYLPVIYEAMHLNADGRLVEDDWTDPDTWYKANPNLGVSKSLDYMREQCQRAKENIEVENEFKRLDLNIRTQQDKRIISMSAWDDCGGDIDWEQFKGQPCWPALDIGAMRDFCSLAVIFAGEENEPVTYKYEDYRGREQTCSFIRRDYWLRHFCWLPEEPLHRDPRMESQIEAWTRQGYLIRTPGNVVDYDQVEGDIIKILNPYSMQQFAIDQGFQGMKITQDLQKIFGDTECPVHSRNKNLNPQGDSTNKKCTCRVIAFRQGIISMAAPFRELMQLIMLKRLHHDNDPVLRWMASNVAAETKGGLVKPSKDKSPEKIDGITAATMAIGVAMTAPAPVKSVYETHGVRVIK